ncbi:MAG: TVP38/TMEM64 family protein [Rhodospirillales bacterium]|nr:TVP38/TMEM64 family protein [Rhodospirillales bacterium]
MLRRLLPVAILLLGLALFLLFGLERYFSFEMLSRHHAELTAWVAGNIALAALIYVLLYAVAVAFSLPIAVVVTPVGGFLFGVWLGALLSVIGATLGSVALFLAARTAFRDLFRARAGAMLARLEDGFRRDSFNYLLFLRLVPVFPFWLVNIVPALLGMRLGPYTLATLVGIVPGAVIYAGVGASFGMLIERGERPDFSVIFEWHILLPLLGLAALSLLPILYVRLRGGKATR